MSQARAGVPGQHVDRPKALNSDQAALARRMHASGVPVNTVAAALGVTAATIYRVLADDQSKHAGEQNPSSPCGG